MARVARYTEDLIEAYVAGGHWTPAYAVDFWRENASRHPERQAVWAPDGCFTWLESIQVIDHYAAALHADGWQRDEVLVLQAPNSAQLLFLRLACELAGVISALVQSPLPELKSNRSLPACDHVGWPCPWALAANLCAATTVTYRCTTPWASQVDLGL